MWALDRYGYRRSNSGHHWRPWSFDRRAVGRPAWRAVPSGGLPAIWAVRTLGVRVQHVSFGHLHRAGPLAPTGSRARGVGPCRPRRAAASAQHRPRGLRAAAAVSSKVARKTGPCTAADVALPLVVAGQHVRAVLGNEALELLLGHRPARATASGRLRIGADDQAPVGQLLLDDEATRPVAQDGEVAHGVAETPASLTRAGR